MLYLEQKQKIKLLLKEKVFLYLSYNIPPIGQVSIIIERFQDVRLFFSHFFLDKYSS